IVDLAVDLLIEKVKKERFAVGCKPRPAGMTKKATSCCGRPIAASVRREVYLRDQARCTFVDENGNRGAETGMLEYDHIDGWARTHSHDPKRIRLRCRAHNQHAAEKMYGREFMERARAARHNRIRPGAGRDALATSTPQLCFRSGARIALIVWDALQDSSSVSVAPSDPLRSRAKCRRRLPRLPLKSTHPPASSPAPADTG